MMEIILISDHVGSAILDDLVFREITSTRAHSVAFMVLKAVLPPGHMVLLMPLGQQAKKSY